MDTITTYVNNMFSTLPQTQRILDLKNEILNNMEDKYNELKNDGKSEHEAISIVISEFGDIDELLRELGIKKGDIIQPTYSLNDIEEYQSIQKKKSKIISLGVILCIMAAGSFQLIEDLIASHNLPSLLRDNGEDITACIPFFLMIAIGVGLFIYSGTIGEKFKDITNNLILDSSTVTQLKTESEHIKARYNGEIIIGVVLCILSPVIYLILAQPLGDDSGLVIFIFFAVVSVAVYLLIYARMTYGTYDELLKHNNLRPEQKQAKRLHGVINSIIFIVATAIYLFCGFCYDLWDNTWFIFVIAAFLCSISSIIIHFLTENKKMNL